MSSSDSNRQREYPGDRFSKRIIKQNLDDLAEQLQEEEFGSGHSNKGHNQIELYRRNGTTVSLFIFEKGGHLPEHSVEDGSVMIQILKGKLCFQTEEAETHLHPEEQDTLILEEGIKHSVQAEKPSRMLVTIMRG